MSDSGILSPQSSADVPVSDLSQLYDEPDPRAYYCSLGRLSYRTPDYVQQLARWVLKQTSQADPWVIDIGCGYGVNGAGLLYGVPIQDLLDRYATAEMTALPSNSVIDLDAAYFSSRRRHTFRIAGLDVSRASLDYGVRAGLLDAAFDDDLTQADPPQDLVEIVQSGALIIESGVPIFIAPHVLDALLSVAGTKSRPWVITAPPRYTNLGVYEEVLDRHDYMMEQVSDVPLPHRRFNSPEEGHRIIEQQLAMGVECDAERDTGYIHVDLYLARSRNEASQAIDFSPVVQPVAPVADRA